MSDREQVLDIEKELLIKNLFQSSQDKKLFKTLDKQLTQQYFTNVTTLSSNENILNLNAVTTTTSELNSVINKFLNIKNISAVFSGRSIYEIVKLSNLPAQKINKVLSPQKIISICDKLSAVSHETKYISFDFLILRIADNFLFKITDHASKKVLTLLKKETKHNLIAKKYQPEKKNKTNTYLCWVDSILNLTIANTLSADEYITVCNKIINLTSPSSDLLWKMSSSASLLLQNSQFSDANNLRNFKRNLQKRATSDSSVNKYNQKKTTELLIQTLAKSIISKEDCYYLFNNLKVLAENNPSDKLYCLKICHYLFYRHTIKKLFSYRHIRENFLKTLFDIITDDDDIEAAETSFLFLCKLLTDKENFEIHFNIVFEKALYLLKKINNNHSIITPQKFYKYCNILDYLAKKNHIYLDLPLYNSLANSYRSIKTIQRHFKSSAFKYSV